MDIVGILIIGLVAGWLASKFIRGRGLGLAGNLVVGVLGAIIGGYVFGVLGVSAGGTVGRLISATVGAAILLFLLKLVRTI
jgi:uncharacterized membrane protein YeaQ/YmgE (transglycosylase-associated protein family)